MRRYWIQYNRVCSGWKRVSLSARARMPADQRRWSRSSAMAAPARKSHNSSQYPPLEYASERARAAGESCASQASVAAAASNCAEAWAAGGTARAAGLWLAGPEAGGAPRRQQARADGGQQQDQRDRGQRRRIVRPHLVQQTPEDATHRQRHRGAAEQPEDNRRQPLAKDHPDQMTWSGAERGADADFVHAPRHRTCHHAVDAEGGQEQGGRGKRRG